MAPCLKSSALCGAPHNAQFEREIISERTRDKISAARRKGKWTGGFVPLGYEADPVSRRLVIHPGEAEQVRRIFAILLEQGSLQAVLQHLEQEGYHTKSGVTRKGKAYAGARFDRPALVRLLTNVLYVGEVRHKGQVYPGEQEAILDQETWTRAKELLESQKREPTGRLRRRGAAILQGRLECGVCGKPMLHGYTSKRGRRYRYYQCLTARKRGAQVCPGQMISARRIEHAVLDRLGELGPRGAPEGAGLHATLNEVIERIRYDHRTEQGTITLRCDGSPGRDAQQIQIAIRKHLFDRNLAPAGATTEPPLPRIAGMMALAIRFEKLLEEGAAKNYKQLARLAKVSTARITQIMKLRSLAPAIQEQLLFLARPAPGLQEPALRRIAEELSWVRQLQMFEERRG